jgi:D-3-phosphoglycerate dehydrogenase
LACSVSDPADRNALTAVTTRVVATGPVWPPTEEILGPVAVAHADAELRELLRDAEAVIVRGGHRFGAELISAAPRLRVIGRTGVGLSEIDLDAVEERGIAIVTAEGGARAVAEGALTLVLALAKRLPQLDRAVKEGRFAERDDADVLDAEDMTLGIVGYGRTGRALAELAEAIGMAMLAYDPYVSAGSLDELLERADAISLHAPLTDETRGLVDADFLGRVRPGAILVNLARGGLVRSLDDLLAALEAGRLSGVGLDVFDPEPPDPAHPLFRHQAVLCTPHALGLSRQAKANLARQCAEGIRSVLDALPGA